MVSRTRTRLVLMIFAVCLATAGALAHSSETIQHESAARLLLGAFVFLFLPGLTWGSILRTPSSSILETIAGSFVFSLAVQMLWLVPALGLHLTITHFVDGVLVTSAAGLAWLWMRSYRSRADLGLLRPLVAPAPGAALSTVLETVSLLAVVGLTVAAYRWGEDILDLAGEKLLHIMFVRYYYDMRFVLGNLGVAPGFPPPNLVNLWEMIIAGWARCVAVDPLIVFYRARAVIPLVGLAGMYTIVRRVSPRPRARAFVFLGVVGLAMTFYTLRCPSLEWIRGRDETRGALAFLGSSHHADSAMDTLLALGVAAGLEVLLRPGSRAALSLVIVLSASFLWHPREYFQLALYLAIFGVTAVVVPALRARRFLKGWALATAVLVGSAALFATLSSALVGRESQSYDEAAIKKEALRDALSTRNLLRVRHLFDFPFVFVFSSSASPDQLKGPDEVSEALSSRTQKTDPWIVLSALAALVLCFAGRKEQRWLGVFYLLLWMLALCWNFSMLILLACTYSEFFMSTPRLLYLFAYLVIVDGAVVVATTPWPARRGARCLFLAGLGSAFSAWGWMGMAGGFQLGWPLTVLAMIAVARTALGRGALFRSPPGLSRSFLLAAALLAGVLALHVPDTIRLLCATAREQPPWFDAASPFGLSRELIAWLQRAPPGSVFLVDPYSLDCVDVYAPVYVSISPGTVLFRDVSTRQEIESGRHPFLAADTAHLPRAVDAGASRAWSCARHIDFILLKRAAYDGAAAASFRAHPESFQVALDRPESRELVFKLTPCSDPH